MGQPAARVTTDAALDRFFDHYYRRRPVQATFTGVHDHDSRLPDWSPEAFESLVGEMRGLRRLLADAGHEEKNDEHAFPHGVDVALADAFLEIQIAEHESTHFVHHNPALWTGEAIFGVIALVTRDFAPLHVRLRSAASRMRAIPAFLGNARRVIHAAPEAWRARAIRECDAGARLCGESLPRWWSALGQNRSMTLQAELNAAASAAAAAFGAFSLWLQRDLPEAPPMRACGGRDFLALLLRRGHWCDTSIDALRDEARRALDEAAGALDRQARELAPGGWPEVQDRLAEAHPPIDDYLPRFERVWHACREMALAHDLVTWPDAPIRYVPIPEQTRDVAPQLYYLSYRSPAPFDALPIHDYVVMPVGREFAPEECRRRLRAANDSTIKLNHVVHHGGLGHHVQNFHAYRGRSRVGQVAAVDGASRIGMFCGGTLAEGWACYACDLAEEAGILTPLESVAQQYTRVRLLTRAAADLDLHTGRRTLEQTAALYRERAWMTPEAAQAEAVKNSMFPGTAVMYWLGTRDLHALRAACEVRDGSAFLLRHFHDRVLSYGAIPMPLIARLMTAEHCQ